MYMLINPNSYNYQGRNVNASPGKHLRSFSTDLAAINYEGMWLIVRIKGVFIGILFCIGLEIPQSKFYWQLNLSHLNY